MSADIDPVMIIGAGWAGIAAALHLHQQGIPCQVFESAPRPGGRARSVVQHGHELDNGQHLLIGAYRETLRLLSLIAQPGASEMDVLLRMPLRLRVWGENEQIHLRAPALPAPLHLATALLTARGISWREKIAALRMGLALHRSGYTLDHDISVDALLVQHRQGVRLTRLFWQPLCIATLNTPPETASAQVFLHVLRDSFSQRAEDAQLLLPKVPLGRLFAESAAKYLGDRVRCRHKVEALVIENGQLTALMINGQQHPCQQAILATSPEAAARLLSPHLPELAAQLRALRSQPITTAYLHYPEDCALPDPMIGLHGGIAQWLTDRRIAGQPGLIAVTISTSEAVARLDKQTLCETLHQEILQHFPDWPAPHRCQLIHERRATFDCRVGIQSQRPPYPTPVSGLYLAGDYTANDYPATLEGAVRSGVQCADYLLQTRAPCA